MHTIEPGDQGKTLLEWLRVRVGLSRESALALLRSRKVRVNGTLCHKPDWRLRAGARVDLPGKKPEARAEGQSPRREPRESPVLRHVDDALVIVEKPAGLTTMRHADEAAEFGPRGKRYLPATLQDLLPNLLASRNRGRPIPVRAVHRLDRDTTGLVAFARTPEAEAHLGQQFREHSIDRLYLAVVRGRAESRKIETHIVRDRGDGRRGSAATGDGQRAVTHVRVVEALGDFTLVECRLETGRTHQVRIHLGESGTPLCGERVYDRPLHGRPVADTSGMPRIALHAATLGLTHPVTGARMSWTAKPPRDVAELVARLRRKASS